MYLVFRFEIEMYVLGRVEFYNNRIPVQNMDIFRSFGSYVAVATLLHV